MNTRKKAMETMISYENKARLVLPWLKGRQHLRDCVAGYSFCVTGKKTKYIWVHEMVTLMIKNKTWTKTVAPKVGDAVIFDWDLNGTRDHVAMFYKKDKLGRFVCYGANQGKSGKVTKIYVNKKYIVGWGSPFKFAEV